MACAFHSSPLNSPTDIISFPPSLYFHLVKTVRFGSGWFFGSFHRVDSACSDFPNWISHSRTEKVGIQHPIHSRSKSLRSAQSTQMFFSQNAFALSSIVFILFQFSDKLLSLAFIIRLTAADPHVIKCLHCFPSHPLLGLLLGKFGCVGHCQSQLPFSVVSHINCKVVYAPVDKFPCFFAFHMFSL